MIRLTNDDSFAVLAAAVLQLRSVVVRLFSIVLFLLLLLLLLARLYAHLIRSDSRRRYLRLRHRLVTTSNANAMNDW